MSDRISIRNARHAKIGLMEMCEYINMDKTWRVLEIGSYVGDSSQIFAQRVEELICVDPWKNGYDEDDAASYQHPMDEVEKQFDENMRKYQNLIKLKMTSFEAQLLFDDHIFDMVYIDGLHTYEGVKNDIYWWVNKVKPGGWLAGHDYQKRFPGTIKAVQEYKKPEKTFKDTSWCMRV